jgi:hypothetical protein
LRRTRVLTRTHCATLGQARTRLGASAVLAAFRFVRDTLRDSTTALCAHHLRRRRRGPHLDAHRLGHEPQGSSGSKSSSGSGAGSGGERLSNASLETTTLDASVVRL